MLVCSSCLPSSPSTYNAPVPLPDCLDRVALQSGLTLACALPFVVIAAWLSRTRRWGLLLFVAILVVLDVALDEIPRVDGFQRLRWSWQESLLSAAWPFLLVAVVPVISLASIGVTSRLRPGWLKPSIIAGLFALTVPTIFFILGVRKKLDAEGWAFLLIMPGLAEELVFRGVYQSLLNRVFGKPWRLANAEFGWALIITSILFAGFNGLVAVDSRTSCPSRSPFGHRPVSDEPSFRLDTRAYRQRLAICGRPQPEQYCDTLREPVYLMAAHPCRTIVSNN